MVWSVAGNMSFSFSTVSRDPNYGGGELNWVQLSDQGVTWNELYRKWSNYKATQRKINPENITHQLSPSRQHAPVFRFKRDGALAIPVLSLLPKPTKRGPGELNPEKMLDKGGLSQKWNQDSKETSLLIEWFQHWYFFLFFFICPLKKNSYPRIKRWGPVSRVSLLAYLLFLSPRVHRYLTSTGKDT